MRRAGVQRDFTSGHESVEGVVAKVEGKVELLLVAQGEALLPEQVQELGETGVVLINRRI